MTTMRPPKPKFVLHLEAQPRPGGDHDGMRRLRAVLKLLLRCFGIEYPQPEEPRKERA